VLNILHDIGVIIKCQIIVWKRRCWSWESRKLNL